MGELRKQSIEVMKKKKKEKRRRGGAMSLFLLLLAQSATSHPSTRPTRSFFLLSLSLALFLPPSIPPLSLKATTRTETNDSEWREREIEISSE
jgi:hypothetical protein